MGEKEERFGFYIINRGSEEQPNVSTMHYHLRPSFHAGVKGHIWVLKPTLVKKTMSISFLGPSYYQRICEHLWSGLQPGSMFKSEG